MTSGNNANLLLWQRLAIASYILLILDILVWEAWGAPAQQASIWFGLSMKLTPLLAGLLPILRGNARVMMWMSLLMLLYITEGLVLSYSEFNRGWGLHSELIYALAESLFSIVFVFSAGTYIKIKYPRPGKT